MLIVSEGSSTGQAGSDRRLARRRLAGPALQHLAHDRVLDLLVLDAGAVERGPDRDRAELGGLVPGERAAEPPEGRAHGRDDHGARHHVRVTSRLAAAHGQRGQRLRPGRLVSAQRAPVAQPRGEHESERNEHDQREQGEGYDDPEMLRAAFWSRTSALEPPVKSAGPVSCRRPTPIGVNVAIGVNASTSHLPRCLSSSRVDDHLTDLARVRGREHQRDPDVVGIRVVDAPVLADPASDGGVGVDRRGAFRHWSRVVPPRNSGVTRS